MLAIDAGTTGVTAVVVGADGPDRAPRGYQEFAPALPAARAGWSTRRRRSGRPRSRPSARCLGQVDGRRARGRRHHQPARDGPAVGPRDAGLAAARDRAGRTVVPPTSARGCARRATRTGSRELTGLRLDPYFSGTKLRWLAEHEPHTWALVESGRYAVGTVDSYLVARMTRGTYHVTDVSNACRTLLLDLTTGRLVRRAVRAVRRAPRRAARAGAELGRDRHHRPALVPRPLAARSRASPATSSRRSSARPASTRATPSAPTAPARSSSPTPAPRWSAPTPGCCPTAAWRSPDGELTPTPSRARSS